MSTSGGTQKYELYSNELAFLLYKYIYVYTLREREREVLFITHCNFVFDYQNNILIAKCFVENQCHRMCSIYKD